WASTPGTDAARPGRPEPCHRGRPADVPRPADAVRPATGRAAARPGARPDGAPSNTGCSPRAVRAGRAWERRRPGPPMPQEPAVSPAAEARAWRAAATAPASHRAWAPAWRAAARARA